MRSRETALSRAIAILTRHGWHNIQSESPYPNTPHMHSITADNGANHPLLNMRVHVIVFEPRKRGNVGKLALVRFTGLGSENREPKTWVMFNIWAEVLKRGS